MNTALCKTIGLALLIAAALPVTVSASDLVLLHGHIYTGAPREPWAEAIAVTGSRIDTVGSDASVLARRESTTRVIDLHGRTVIPGVVDSHLHTWLGALALHGFNLSTPEASITPDKPDELIARIQEYAAHHPTDKILFGRGDFSSVPPFSPSYRLLDRAVSDRPIVIHNMGEHALWLNSKALALAGITDKSLPDPTEERNVIRDARWHPTGVIIEAAMEAVERFVKATLPVEDQLQMIREATRYLNGYGITSVVNASGDLAEIRLYAALRDRGQLTVRTRTAFGAVAVPHRLTPQFLADLEEARTKYHDEWVSGNLVKFFADGGTGMVPPLVYEPSQLRTLAVELDRRGYQLMTHASRPDNVPMVLDVYDAVVRANGRRDRRLRIEHDLTIQDADFPRYRELSVIASMEPGYCCGEFGTNYDPKELVASDQWQTLLKNHVVLAFNSDWPCLWPPSPFFGIQEAVTREIWAPGDTAVIIGQELDGAAQGGARPTGKTYAPEQRLTVRQAVDAYTQGSAYAAFEDTQLGTLETGKLADLAVLSQDIFSVAPTEIGKTRVEMTMVGGKLVYQAEP
jgi:predicted amidohydrolase YtcJ